MATAADAASGALTRTAASVRRVGVFGGTFDPPHMGHVSVAAEVADRLDLDEVLWIPAHRSPLKRDRVPTAPALRLEMVRQAAKSDARFRVLDVELTRPGPSWTIDTLEDLARTELADAEVFLIIGADQHRDFERWRSPERILERATLLVMDRDGDAAETARPGVVRVPVRRVDVSSSDVRARVRAGRPIADLVPDAVAAIIAREGLYSDDPVPEDR